MRICFLTTSYPRWPDDPAGIFVSSLAKNIAVRGHEVTVIAPSAGNVSEVNIPRVRVRRFRYCWPSSAGRVAYGPGVLENLRHPIAWLQLPFFLLAANFALWRHARQADIIHIHWWHNAALVLAALHMIRRPLVITVHGSDVSQILRSGLQRSLAKLVFHRASQIIAVSRSMATTLAAIGIPSKKISIIPNGIPDGEKLLAITERQDFHGKYLAIGRLIPVKNHAMLLNAFAALLKKQPSATLNVIGDGPLRQQLQALVDQLHVNGHVTFFGQQDRPVVIEALATADIIVLSSRYEGFGLAALEAMAAGKPVVATAVGGITDFVIDGQTGLLVPDDDQSAMAQSMERLFVDAALRRRLGQSARQVVQESYLWPTIAIATEKVYEQARTTNR